mgnify:CR=1 FL=1
MKSHLPCIHLAPCPKGYTRDLDKTMSPPQTIARVNRPYNELKGHGLVLEPGRSVLELRASSLTKGDALRELVRETGASAVAMCGDDLGDLVDRRAGVDAEAVGATRNQRPVLVQLEQRRVQKDRQSAEHHHRGQQLRIFGALRSL